MTPNVEYRERATAALSALLPCESQITPGNMTQAITELLLNLRCLCEVHDINLAECLVDASHQHHELKSPRVRRPAATLARSQA